MKRTGLAGAIAAALCAAACASSNGQTRTGAAPERPEGRSAFPPPDELAAIARRPPPARVFSAREPEASAWELKGAPDQLPAQVDRRPDGFWDGLLAAQAASRGGAVRATEPMACLARLAGQYTLERRSPPGQSTLAFLGSRCGVADPRLGYSFVDQPLRGGEGEDDIQERMRPAAEQGIRNALEGGERTAGIWFGRERLRAVAMLVHARPLARLVTLPAVPGPDGHVVLRGELLRPAHHLDALVNRGRYGFRRCSFDPSVALPRFAVDCETDPADESETLEIAAFPPGRVMGPIVLRAMVWPRGKLPTAWRQSAAARAGEAGHDPAGALVSSLNEVRAAAGLPPATLAASQSETAGLLAPHYFAAEGSQQADQVDAIAVGVMAGWQIGGPVRAGHFTAGWTADAAAEGGLLDSVLERPSGREALLDPDVRAVAVGVVREEWGVGAIFGTYAFLEQAPPGVEAAVVVKRIDEARALRGLPATLAFDRISRDVAGIAAAVERGELDTRAATRSLLDRVVHSATSGRAYAWVGYGERLDRVAFPEEVVSATAVQVSVGVAHCKPKGSPWFGYCVLVAAVQQGVTASAGDAGARRGSPLALGLSKGERAIRPE